MSRHPALPLAGLTLLAGCSNPLFPRDADYGRQIAAERLRSIETLPLREYARPQPAEPRDAVEEAQRQFAAAEKVDLALEECRVSALTQNLNLEVALIDPAIAAANLSEEEARFESTFTLRTLWSETDTPTTDVTQSSQAEFTLIEPGVTVPLRSGGTATIGLPMSRSQQNAATALVFESYAADLALSFSQPLLRNAGRWVNTAPIRIASYNRQAAEAQTKLAVIRELTGVDRAYWALYAARRALEVTQQQLELAQAQLERAERQVRAGKVAEIEVIRAQSGVADRLGSIITAQNEVLSRQRELKRIMNRPELDVDSPTHIVPTTPPDPVQYELDPPALIAGAIDQRMELLDVELRLLADAANIDIARNALLPQVDVEASYRINGLGGSEGDALYDNDLSSMAANNFEDWSLGLTGSIPIGNEAARSRLRQAVLSRLQRLWTREAQRQLVRQEVLDAVDRIQADWQRILAARQSVILNARTLQAEQRQFDVGSSTSTDVLNAATDLALSQLAEIRALTDYQLAQADLAQATGTLLGAARVDWAPAEPTPEELQRARPEEPVDRK